MRPPLSLKQALFLIGLFSFSNLSAEDTIFVEPGTGTLEMAIEGNGGNKVYQLKAGERYVLDNIIEVDDQGLGGPGKTLTIVGEKTKGMPAVIQVGNEPSGAVRAWLFKCEADLVLKNLFLVDQDQVGVPGRGVIEIIAPVRVVVDGCIIDPAGTNRTFGGGNPADGAKLFLTNSQIYRNGKMDTPNDGGWLAGMAWDTLWVENNTLVSSGQDFIGTPFHNIPNNQFIWINHNTILWHDVWIKKSYNDQNFYFTNNLLHDINIFPELPRWYQFFPDFTSGNTLLCQTAIDTLEIGGVPENLPSERVVFWEYNMMYCSPELQALPKYAADNGKELTYLLPMLWDEDVPLSYSGGVEIVSPADSCRENRILSDNVNWPFMKYNNNWYDIDPLYKDPMIYNINDSVGEHILGFYRGQFWEEPGAPAVDELPSYNWDIDDWNDIDPADFPSTWPRFEGSYTSPDLLTASIEGLPLGDLNWYPDLKVWWEADKEKIETHILSLNEEHFVMTPLSTEKLLTSSDVRFYPNPSNEFLIIEAGDWLGANVQIIDVMGRVCKETILRSGEERINFGGMSEGIYFLSLKKPTRQFIDRFSISR